MSRHHNLHHFKNCNSSTCSYYNQTQILQLKNSLKEKGASEGEFSGRSAVEDGRRRVRASRSMASNPPDPH
eukprot:1160419-Pelagomonas_calceolata.AAC.2